MKLSAKEILRPSVTLFVIALCAALLLASTNLLTKEKIRENGQKKENESRSFVLSTAAEFIPMTTADGEPYYLGRDADGNTVGYVLTATAKGYGGDVQAVVGYGLDGSITGVRVLADGETPGLGANAAKESFGDRYIGKSGHLVVSKNTNEGQNVQAITSATITSTAVVNAVNATADTLAKIMTEGGE